MEASFNDQERNVKSVYSKWRKDQNYKQVESTSTENLIAMSLLDQNW